MKILVCPDSFKGSLSAIEAAETIKQGVGRKYPGAEIFVCPLSDGGEGLLEIIKYASHSMNSSFQNWDEVFLPVNDSLLRETYGNYIYSSSQREAIIESSVAIGLAKLLPEDRNIMQASSYGLGELIEDALKRGAKKINIGLGGSAVNDGGMGMLTKLGWKFLDSNGKTLIGKGENLNEIVEIIPPEIHLYRNVRFRILADVKNPLFGDNGASFVYGPQKGGKDDEIVTLDKGLRNFSYRTQSIGIHEDYAFIPGSGAAGGLGFGLLSFMNAEIESGIEYVKKINNLDEKIQESDIIITGEGKIDRQSLMGKVLSGILETSSKNSKKLIGIAGKIEDKDELEKNAFYKLIEIYDPRLSLEENMKAEVAKRNILNAIESSL